MSDTDLRLEVARLRAALQHKQEEARLLTEERHRLREQVRRLKAEVAELLEERRSIIYTGQKMTGREDW